MFTRIPKSSRWGTWAVATACSIAFATPSWAAKKPAPKAAAPTPAPAVEAPLPKPWPAQRFTLANGMRVVVHTERSAPVVAVGVLVDVGSRDEEEGLSGLAHFFEHMMFQGSKRLGKMEHFKLLEAQGGEVNANTSVDRTWYYQIVPKPALELALWLEAERFGHLKIDAANVDNQRQAVLAEMSERYDNQPLARSQLAVPELAYTQWALRHSTIGQAEDLKTAPLKAFQDFWQRWYSPENCVLVLSGDIDVPQVRPLLEATVARIKPRGAPPRSRMAETAAATHRFAVVRDPLAQAPAVHLAWKVPAAPTPDAAALDLLAQILGGGEASRLEKRLVREKPLVTSYYAATHGRRDHDLLQIYAELTEPSAAALQEVKRRIRAEILDIAQNGLRPGELARAKTVFEASWVNAASSPATRAELLASFEAYHGDANKLADLLPLFRAVDAAAVQRVAQRWLRWDREAEIDALPTSMAETHAAPKPEWIARAEKQMAEAEALKAAAKAKAEQEAQRRAAEPPPASPLPATATPVGSELP